MMKSKLLSKLANSVGINIFNWKSKTNYYPDIKRVIPQKDMSQEELHQQAMKYFGHVIVQDKFIRLLVKLLNEYDFEVQKWDTIQAGHEQEIANIKAECKQLVDMTIVDCKNKIHQNDIIHRESKVAHLSIKISQLEKKIKELEGTPRRPLIATDKLESMMSHLNTIYRAMDGTNSVKEASRVRAIGFQLQRILKVATDNKIG